MFGTNESVILFLVIMSFTDYRFTVVSYSIDTVQHTATHCNTLQHTATHCNTLQHTATHCTRIPDVHIPYFTKSINIHFVYLVM